jgi:hypothetical protein
MQYVFYAWRLFFVFGDCLEIAWRLFFVFGDFRRQMTTWGRRTNRGPACGDWTSDAITFGAVMRHSFNHWPLKGARSFRQLTRHTTGPLNPGKVANRSSLGSLFSFSNWLLRLIEKSLFFAWFAFSNFVISLRKLSLAHLHLSFSSLAFFSFLFSF